MRVTLGGIGKTIFVTLLLIASVAAMPTGLAMTVFKSGWGKVIGLLLLVGGFRGVILFLDLVWERPPQFSKRSWERPWENEEGPRH